MPLLPLGFRDRRERQMCIQKAMIALIVFFWFSAVAVGQQISDLTEHSQSIIPGLLWLVVSLFGGITTIILLFYAYSQRANTNASRAMIARIDDLSTKSERNLQLLLKTMTTLEKLHGEHSVMMNRCARVSKLKDEDEG
jgi:hypothetical protein